ncbi:hypothetical protein IWW50_005212 [Coemansia erecta]|nr:hypothetical protein IWW50_005212 [Coemansia erecta]
MDEEQRSHENSEDHNSNNGAQDEAPAVLWRDDLTNLLTPQTVTEQAQTTRRRRNREAARRSRQRLKDREHELVERQEMLTQRLEFLEQELAEWRLINASSGSGSTSKVCLVDPDETSNSEDCALAININRIYNLTMDTLNLISQLQLQLDAVTSELTSMIDAE